MATRDGVASTPSVGAGLDDKLAGGEANVYRRIQPPAGGMATRFRKVLGRFFLVFLVMSGMLVLLGRAVMEMVAPTPSLAAAENPPGPDVDTKAYSYAFIQEILYGAATHWDAGKVEDARGMALVLYNQVQAYPDATALLGDQIAYMDWLLECRDPMGGAMAAVELGNFGAAADGIASQVAACRTAAADWVEQTIAHAAQYPAYTLGSIPGYGTWNTAAFAELGLLDVQAAPALDALVPFASFFAGGNASGPAPAAVAALFDGKELRGPLASSGSTAWALAGPKVDASTAVGMWLRQSAAMGDTDVRLELREDGGELRVCGASSQASFCPAGSGALLQAVNASFSGDLTVFGAGDADGQEWGFVVRNGGSSALEGLTARAECVDGSHAAEWSIGDVGAAAQVFSSHAFDEDVACLATLELRDADDQVVLLRVGEIAGDFGFAV